MQSYFDAIAHNFRMICMNIEFIVFGWLLLAVPQVSFGMNVDNHILAPLVAEVPYSVGAKINEIIIKYGALLDTIDESDGAMNYRRFFSVIGIGLYPSLDALKKLSEQISAEFDDLDIILAKEAIYCQMHVDDDQLTVLRRSLVRLNIVILNRIGCVL